jgi:hypothetical protein
VITLTVVAPLGGIAILWGARKMRRLQSRRWAVAACLLALVPWNPLSFVFGLPAGAWGLVFLHRPDVRAALPGAWPRPKGPSRVRAFLSTTTGWAIVVCLAGAMLSVCPVGPWAELQAVPDEGRAQVLASVFGYETWYGFLPAVLFLTVFLVLATTAFLGPVPLWQPLVFLASGAVVSVTVLTGVGGNTQLEDWGRAGQESWGTFQATIFHHRFTGQLTGEVGGWGADGRPRSSAVYRLADEQTRIHYLGPATPVGAFARLRTRACLPAFATAACGLALILIGSLQLRSILRGRQAAPA